MTAPPHGTHARYVSKKHPCKCSKCRHANTVYKREWRKRPGLAQKRAREASNAKR